MGRGSRPRDFFEEIKMSKPELRKLLISHFNKSELRGVCSDLGINHESLRGETVDDLALDLVDYCARRGLLEKLISKVPLTLSTPSNQQIRKRYLVGKQLKLLRKELGLETSAFKDVIGFPSEKEYQQIEADEVEVDETFLQSVYEATGALPEWLMYGGEPCYEVDLFKVGTYGWTSAPQEALKIITELHPKIVYLTIATTTPISDFPIVRQIKDIHRTATFQNLHLGLCLQLNDFRHKIFDLHLAADLWELLSKEYASPFFKLVDSLLDDYGAAVRGFIINNLKDDWALYNGSMYPGSILSKYHYRQQGNWIIDLMSLKNDESVPNTYAWMYGNWFVKLHKVLRETNRLTLTAQNKS